MKKHLFVPILLVIFPLSILIPINYLAGDTENIILNGDFESGDFTGWIPSGNTSVVLTAGSHKAKLEGSESVSIITQTLSPKNWMCLNLSYDIKTIVGTGGNIYVSLMFYDGSNFYSIEDYYNATMEVNVSYNLLARWKQDNPSIDPGSVDLLAISGMITPVSTSIVYFDNFRLYCPVPDKEPEPIVHTHDMTCWQVWINEDNNFEFIFWWVYKNNNWVQIYDIEGNLVWETDFPKDEPHFEVDLPDGMYKVQTFHEAGQILQEFYIGKP